MTGRFRCLKLLLWAVAELVMPLAWALPPGSHELALRHAGRERAFIVHVPRSYRIDRPAPLVLALHGGGGSMDVMARDRLYGLVSQSERSGWIVVFRLCARNRPTGELGPPGRAAPKLPALPRTYARREDRRGSGTLSCGGRVPEDVRSPAKASGHQVSPVETDDAIVSLVA
jgi:hypothetical protein